MVKLCVFDLDGTLVNTLHDITDSLNFALAACGFPALTESRVAAIVGHSVNFMCEHALPPEHKDQADRVLALYTARYKEHSLDRSHAYDGMIEAVERIKAAGVTVAIASNKPHADTVKVAGTLYPKNLFSLVLGRMDKFAIKPAPDVLRFIMDFFKVTPEESVYVGDSDVDVQFAHNAGMRCVSVNWGFRSVDEILAAGGTCITGDPKQVPELVLQDPGKIGVC
ncbi:MAG TPA: phosphoglycolate phosphatase [Clostridiales bacterium]|jgi:phosphoglycolate phosphatase|nr:phosphoglycolate phosphatase [Clostridiales bacterium]